MEWVNAVANVSASNLSGRLNDLQSQLEIAAGSARTLTVRGDGNCLLRAFNATFLDETTSKDVIRAIAHGTVDTPRHKVKVYDGPAMFRKWIQHRAQDLNMSNAEYAKLVEAELKPGDLADTSKNDLSSSWLDVFAVNLNRHVYLLSHRYGNFGLLHFEPPTPTTNKTFILLYEGHYWPLIGAVDPSRWGKIQVGFQMPGGIVMPFTVHLNERVSKLFEYANITEPGIIMYKQEEVDTSKTFNKNKIYQDGARLKFYPLITIDVMAPGKEIFEMNVMPNEKVREFMMRHNLDQTGEIFLRGDHKVPLDPNKSFMENNVSGPMLYLRYDIKTPGRFVDAAIM